MQAFGDSQVDASKKLLAGRSCASPRPTIPGVAATLARTAPELAPNGLVYRYLGCDGLPGPEATFTICSFWLVDNLALVGDEPHTAAGCSSA